MLFIRYLVIFPSFSPSLNFLIHSKVSYKSQYTLLLNTSACRKDFKISQGFHKRNLYTGKYINFKCTIPLVLTNVYTHINTNLCQDKEHYHHPQNFPHDSPGSNPCPNPPVLICFHHKFILLVQGLDMNGAIQYVFFSGSFSCSIKVLGFIYVVAWIRSSFLWLKSIPVVNLTTDPVLM